MLIVHISQQPFKQDMKSNFMWHSSSQSSKLPMDILLLVRLIKDFSLNKGMFMNLLGSSYKKGQMKIIMSM